MALCLVKAAASPITGTWEGMKNGVKAATITVRENDGILSGSVIFYIIIRDEGSGTHNGSAQPAMPMVGTQWDGKVLRFSVNQVAFELRVTGEGQAEMRRLAQNGMPEESVKMARAR
jgi:hypothetical protein